MNCIHAYTEPGHTYPAYLSLNTNAQGKHLLTVRSPQQGGNMMGTIELTEEQLVEFARKILNNFCGVL